MNPYIKYNFKYDEKKSYNKFKEVLINNKINSFDSFINFVNQYDSSFSYDTIYSYYTGKRTLTNPILKLIHENLNISYQELILPNSSCLYEDKINDASLIINDYNDYRISYYEFGLYENLCFHYKDEMDEELKLEDLNTIKFEKFIISSLTAYEKRLCRLLYLLQKQNQTILSNYEKKQVSDGLYYIYSFDSNDEFLRKLKEFPSEEFMFKLFNTYSLTFLFKENPGFLTLLFYGTENVVNKMLSYINPIEKDILLTIINDWKDSNSIKLKKSLIELGASKLMIKIENEKLNNCDCPNFDEIMKEIYRIKSLIHNLNYQKYIEIKEVCHE